MTLSSQVIISSQLEQTALALEALRRDEQIIVILSPSMAAKLIQGKEDVPADPMVHRIVSEKESFRIADAKVLIEKAYLASENQTVIILIAENFPVDVQNKLLKIIEEPPQNKIFILLTQSKSTVLPTIKSRLPVMVFSEQKEEASLGLDLNTLSLETAYAFIQTHKRTDSKTMIRIVERLSSQAIASDKYDLDETTLTLFSNAFLALDMGSPPQFVLNTMLLKLLARKKR